VNKEMRMKKQNTFLSLWTSSSQQAYLLCLGSQHWGSERLRTALWELGGGLGTTVSAGHLKTSELF
jgi:hypothetical protein